MIFNSFRFYEFRSYNNLTSLGMLREYYEILRSYIEILAIFQRSENMKREDIPRKCQYNPKTVFFKIILIVFHETRL